MSEPQELVMLELADRDGNDIQRIGFHKIMPPVPVAGETISFLNSPVTYRVISREFCYGWVAAERVAAWCRLTVETIE